MKLAEIMAVVTAGQKAIIDGFNAEEKKEFLKMEQPEGIILLDEILAVSKDAKVLDGKIDFDNAILDDGDCRIHIAGSLLLRKGISLVAQYMGLQHTFSKEKKQHWVKVLAQDGKTSMYRSVFHRFRRTDGTEFGIFATPMMNNALRTLLTISSGSKFASVDPTVKLAYKGLITQAVAKEEYNFVFDNDETHGWGIEVEKSAKRGTGRGCMNQLNAPLPIGTGDDADLTQDEVNMRNFNANKASEVAQIENNGNVQVTQ